MHQIFPLFPQVRDLIIYGTVREPYPWHQVPEFVREHIAGFQSFVCKFFFLFQSNFRPLGP